MTCFYSPIFKVKYIDIFIFKSAKLHQIEPSPRDPITLSEDDEGMSNHRNKTQNI